MVTLRLYFKMSTNVILKFNLPFLMLYWMFLSLNQEQIINSGYDSFRFLNSGLNQEYDEITTINGLLIVQLIHLTKLNNFPLYCSIGLFFSMFCRELIKHKFSVSFNNEFKIFFTTPILIIYLESGKDIMIVTSLFSLLFLFIYCRSFFTLNGISLLLPVIAMSVGSILIAVSTKGNTILIYYALAFYMFVNWDRFTKNILFVVLIFLAFFVGHEVRGLVDYNHVAQRTSFSHYSIISYDSYAQSFIAGTIRVLIYFTSPFWYWVNGLYVASSSSGMVLHAIGYVAMLYSVLKFKLWKSSTYLLASALFAYSYPFVHLRYFFTFVVFLVLYSEITQKIRQKNTIHSVRVA